MSKILDDLIAVISNSNHHNSFMKNYFVKLMIILV